jgi:hypothetical protein
MQDYDVTLKNILTRPGSALVSALTGSAEVRWLEIESPMVRNTRRDLLGELPGRRLVGIEIQTGNESRFGFRLGEYMFGTARRRGRMPRQIVLYIGRGASRLPRSIEGPDHFLRFHVVDIRDLDGEMLLASENLGDNVIAVLTRLGSQPGTVRRILERIATAPEAGRRDALSELAILAGLRELTDEVREEAKEVLPVREILKNSILGPPFLEGRAQGRAEGLAEGLAEGVAKGQLKTLLGLLERRFGSVPPRFRKRFAAMTSEQLTEASMRIFDAARIEDLLVQ